MVVQRSKSRGFNDDLEFASDQDMWISSEMLNARNTIPPHTQTLTSMCVNTDTFA